MKVTFVISALYGGGAERVTCNVASYLADHGHKVDILAISDVNKSYDVSSKVNVYYLLKKRRRNKLINNIYRMKVLFKYFRDNYANTVYIAILPKIIIMMLLLKKITGCKLIISERNNPSKYSRLIKLCLQKFICMADGCVFQTEDAKQWYLRYKPNINNVIIPNPVSDAFIKSPYIGDRRKCIVSVGRLEKQKNFSLLIKSFANIAKEYQEYKIIIYGEGSQRKELEKLVSGLGLSNRVYLPGNVKNISEEIYDAMIYIYYHLIMRVCQMHL